MEGVEGRGVVGCDDAATGGRAVDDEPDAGGGGVQGRDGVEHVAVVEHGEAAVGEVGAPDAEDHVVGGEEEGVQVGGGGGGDGC